MPGGSKANRREAAVAALLGQPTVKKAAQRCGVGYSTLKLWLTEPAFKQMLAEARTALLERTVGQLLAATGAAVRTLRRTLKAEKDGDAIRAAVAILTHGVKGAEVLDLEARLSALEAARGQKKGRGK